MTVEPVETVETVDTVEMVDMVDTVETVETVVMVEISDFSPSVIWRNVKLIPMWRNFIFLHICHVQKFEIPPYDRFVLHGHL